MHRNSKQKLIFFFAAIIVLTGVWLMVARTLPGSRPMHFKHKYYVGRDRYNRPISPLDGSLLTDDKPSPVTEPSSHVDDKYGKAVVLLSYMRSGSSFVGDILQQSPGAFYVFEPFRSVWHIFLNSNDSVHYVDGTIRKQPFDFVDEAVDNLRQWLTCNTSRLQVGGLSDAFLNYGKKSSMIHTCYKEQKEANQSRDDAMTTCAAKLKPICQESPIRIFKTIRLQLSSMVPLLDEIPGLKVIHLVRDPRPTLSAQNAYGQCTPKNGGKEGCTNLYCGNLENNILQQEKLQLKYPGRIITVFYENIAMTPQAEARRLYKFLGTTYTPEADEYIYNITMAGKEDNCDLCTTRSNSSEHVDKWKKSIPTDLLKIVQNRCNFVLKYLGYELHSPDLKKK